MLPPEADIDPFGTCILALLPRMLRPPTLSVPLTLPDDAVNDPVKVALPADKLVADTFPEKVALAAVIAFVILKLKADRDPVKTPDVPFKLFDNIIRPACTTEGRVQAPFTIRLVVVMAFAVKAPDKVAVVPTIGPDCMSP